MSKFLDIFISVLLCGGVIFLICWAKGKFVLPVRSDENTALTMVITAKGDGETLEQTVRGLIWLCESGNVSMMMEIEDAGLSIQGKSLAEKIEKKYERVSLRENAPQ